MVLKIDIYPNTVVVRQDAYCVFILGGKGKPDYYLNKKRAKVLLKCG